MSDLLHEIKREIDSYDQWGSAMAPFFDVAAELWWRGECVPSHWQYTPGMASDPRDPESYFFELAGDSTNDELIYAGNVLERYTRNLDRRGLSY